MEFAQRSESSSQSQVFSRSGALSQRPFEPESGMARSVQNDSYSPGPVSDPAVLQCRMDLMAHWADEPERRVVRSKPQRPNVVRSGFDRLTSGERGHSLAMKNAPSEIALPKEMTQAMQVAWNQSLPEGRAKEQGGLLVRNKNGSLKWLRSAAGTAKEISLNYNDVDSEQTILAGGHTHPYDHNEFDFTDVPFSGRDLAEQVRESQRLSIVQSGDAMFGSARTREFEDLVNSRDEAGKAALSREIEHFWDAVYEDTKGSTPEKSEAATRATAEWFHLLYYTGKQGALKRVDTSASSEVGGR